MTGFVAPQRGDQSRTPHERGGTVEHANLKGALGPEKQHKNGFLMYFKVLRKCAAIKLQSRFHKFCVDKAFRDARVSIHMALNRTEIKTRSASKFFNFVA